MTADNNRTNLFIAIEAFRYDKLQQVYLYLINVGLMRVKLNIGKVQRLHMYEMLVFNRRNYILSSFSMSDFRYLDSRRRLYCDARVCVFFFVRLCTFSLSEILFR